MRKRRRQRLGVLGGSLGVVAIGVLVAFLVFNSGGSPDEPDATSSPKAAQAITVPEKEPVACDAKLPKTAGSKKKQYDEASNQNLDPEKTYVWHLETSCGDVDIELDVSNAPKTSNSIAFLAREGFYDGTFFHRIVKDFVAQGGDPEGSGSGGSGYNVVEAPPKDIKYTEGTVAMAKAGTDPAGSSSSQFFIVVSDHGQEVLTPDYAVLGEVVEGMDIVKEIEQQGHAVDNVPPKAWVYIERSTIVES